MRDKRVEREREREKDREREREREKERERGRERGREGERERQGEGERERERERKRNETTYWVTILQCTRRESKERTRETNIGWKERIRGGMRMLLCCYRCFLLDALRTSLFVTTCFPFHRPS